MAVNNPLRELLKLAVREGTCLVWTGPTDKLSGAPVFRADARIVDVRELFWIHAGEDSFAEDHHLVPECESHHCVEPRHMRLESMSRACIQCGETFQTWDRKRNQHCPSCARIVKQRG